MSNTHTAFITTAAIFAMLSFTAQAQTVSVESPALQTEAAPVAAPRSIMQRYVPADAPVRNADAPLQLLIDDSQASQSQSPVSVTAPLAMSDEIVPQPAINALGPGRFALTVSRVSRPAR